jgi:hypothetical protein
VSSI